AWPGLGEPIAFDWPFSHLSKAAGVITTAVERIVAWPRPHNSVQTTSKQPSRPRVMCSVGGIPGTVSCFCPHSGTQKQRITSFDFTHNRTQRPGGSIRVH